ncbi:MAG: hypothetical protein KF718_28710 [Polyangiaceae bacterium]|nr:hypothetical protein [Polyangiaceae bacterium]
MSADHYKVCSTCRTPIPFGGEHYVCSVSTCNRTKTALLFCSVGCWDAHLPMMKHRDAWAEKATAPTRAAVLAEQARQRDDEVAAGADAERRRRVVTSQQGAELPRDVLVVVSKLKGYVRARSEMNTSDNVVPVLSEHLRRLCDQAIRNAARDGRKTVLDRDFLPLLE